MPKKADYGKLRTNLTLTMTRMKMLTKKRSEQSAKKRKEIADLLSAAKLDHARIQVEYIIREDYFIGVVDIIEGMCDLLQARLGLIQTTNDLDPSLEPTIETIIWASDRLKGDVPEIKVVAKQLKAKYGKGYAEKCCLNEFGHVNKVVMDKMHVVAPSSVLIENYLIEIAKTYKVPFEPDPLRMQIQIKFGGLDQSYALDSPKPKVEQEGIARISAPIPITVTSLLDDRPPEPNGAVANHPPMNGKLSPSKPEKCKSDDFSFSFTAGNGDAIPNKGTGNVGVAAFQETGFPGMADGNSGILPGKCGLAQFGHGGQMAMTGYQYDEPPPEYEPPTCPVGPGAPSKHRPPPLPAAGPNANTLSRTAKNVSLARPEKNAPVDGATSGHNQPPSNVTTIPPRPSPTSSSVNEVSPIRPEKSASYLGHDYSPRSQGSVSPSTWTPIPPRPSCAKATSPSPQTKGSSLGTDYSITGQNLANELSPKPIPPRPKSTSSSVNDVSPGRPEKSPSYLGHDYSPRSQDSSFSSNEPSPRPIPPRPNVSVMDTSLSPGDSGRASLSPNYQNSSLSSNEASPRIPPRPKQSRHSTESINRDALLPGFPELPDCSDLNLPDVPGQTNSPQSPNDVDDLTRRFNALRGSK